MHAEQERCVDCGACAEACRMNIHPVKELNHAECIRCGDCVRVCSNAVLRLGLAKKQEHQT